MTVSFTEAIMFVSILVACSNCAFKSTNSFLASSLAFRAPNASLWASPRSTWSCAMRCEAASKFWDKHDRVKYKNRQTWTESVSLVTKSSVYLSEEEYVSNSMTWIFSWSFADLASCSSVNSKSMRSVCSSNSLPWTLERCAWDRIALD